MNKYLEALEEKLQNAKDDLIHWEIKKEIPSQFTNEEIDVVIEKLSSEITAYTDCIELYKSMQSAWYEKHYCTDCKEYDKDNSCCHRFSKVIQTTYEENQEYYKEQLQVLDILKKKHPIIDFARRFETFEEFDNIRSTLDLGIVWKDVYKVTQEEFEIVKRWLSE